MKHYNDLVHYRRTFRPMAETGFLEMNTTIELIKIIKSFGFEVRYGKEIHGNREGDNISKLNWNPVLYPETRRNSV